MVTFIETIVHYTFASFGISAVPFLNLPFQLMLTPLAFMKEMCLLYDVLDSISFEHLNKLYFIFINIGSINI